MQGKEFATVHRGLLCMAAITTLYIVVDTTVLKSRHYFFYFALRLRGLKTLARSESWELWS